MIYDVLFDFVGREDGEEPKELSNVGIRRRQEELKRANIDQSVWRKTRNN
jgi:hypothetical protein